MFTAVRNGHTTVGGMPVVLKRGETPINRTERDNAARFGTISPHGVAFSCAQLGTEVEPLPTWLTLAARSYKSC